MKRALILTLGLAVASAATFAGDSERKRGGGDRMARMQEHLGLSDEQMQQMREIRLNGGSREDIRAILTDEQRAIMEEHRAQRRQGQGGRQGHGHPPDKDRHKAETDDG